MPPNPHQLTSPPPLSAQTSPSPISIGFPPPCHSSHKVSPVMGLPIATLSKIPHGSICTTPSAVSPVHPYPSLPYPPSRSAKCYPNLPTPTAGQVAKYAPSFRYSFFLNLSTPSPPPHSPWASPPLPTDLPSLSSAPMLLQFLVVKPFMK